MNRPQRGRMAAWAGESPAPTRCGIAHTEFMNITPDDEIAKIRQRIAEYPTDLQLRFELGVALCSCHDYSAAIPELQRATGLNPPEKLRQMPWSISGSPAEFSQELGMYKGERLTKFSDFHVPAMFRSLKRKDGFDYFRFEVDSGINECPKHYGGVSGGGIWLPIIEEMKDHRIDYPPLLQGVVFYESRPYNNGAKRMLIGHGPDSIYNRLMQAL